MEIQQVFMQEKLNNLKDILIHSKNNKDIYVEISVLGSRWRKIINDYYTRNGIFVGETMYDKYDYFILSNLDENNNIYKIIKLVNEKDEIKNKCIKCDCNNKRYINPETGVCFYKEAVENNYLTKI